MRKAGQNTSEFLVLMTLVVVPTIALLSVFSSQIHQKISYLANVIAGTVEQADTAQQMNDVVSYEALIRARQSRIGMEGMNVEELEYGPGK